MSKPDAKVILDSVNGYGDRLTTMEVTFHRFVLAEFNTHRVFSRNSASSRAIPVEKQLARIAEAPAYPLKWPAEQPGMQGGRDLLGEDLEAAEQMYMWILQSTLDQVDDYYKMLKEKYGPNKDDWQPHALHKSVVNRLLEPFMWHTVIVTATNWDGFWDQRCSPLAQPEIEAPAELMWDLYKTSEPTLMEFGEWHTPYIQPEEYETMDLEQRKHISAARCARVSYLTHDGRRDLEADMKLFRRLTEETPPHASPLEHVATPRASVSLQDSPFFQGNFEGWDQLRHEYWR